MNVHPHDEDVDFEPEDELGSTGALQAKLKKLREELESVKKERQEFLDGWQRCKADAVNLRKDVERAAEESARRLRDALAEDIIPALDSFDMAAASDAWESVSDGWKNGMEMVRDQLLDALRRHGIERYGKVGEPVDHALHEVLSEEEGPGKPGDILRVVRFGYRTGSKVIRPAHVIAKKS